jgi:hypothetical protein
MNNKLNFLALLIFSITISFVVEMHYYDGSLLRQVPTIVHSISPSSAAYEKGVREGDRFVSLNGEKLDNFDRTFFDKISFVIDNKFLLIDVNGNEKEVVFSFNNIGEVESLFIPIFLSIYRPHYLFSDQMININSINDKEVETSLDVILEFNKVKLDDEFRLDISGLDGEDKKFLSLKKTTANLEELGFTPLNLVLTDLSQSDFLGKLDLQKYDSYVSLNDFVFRSYLDFSSEMSKRINERMYVNLTIKRNNELFTKKISYRRNMPSSKIFLNKIPVREMTIEEKLILFFVKDDWRENNFSINLGEFKVLSLVEKYEGGSDYKIILIGLKFFLLLFCFYSFTKIWKQVENQGRIYHYHQISLLMFTVVIVDLWIVNIPLLPSAVISFLIFASCMIVIDYFKNRSEKPDKDTIISCIFIMFSPFFISLYFILLSFWTKINIGETKINDIEDIISKLQLCFYIQTFFIAQAGVLYFLRRRLPKETSQVRGV